MKKQRAKRKFNATIPGEAVELVALVDDSYENEIQSRRTQELVNKMIFSGRIKKKK